MRYTAVYVALFGAVLVVGGLSVIVWDRLALEANLPAPLAVNFVGPLSGDTGLAESARALFEVFQAANVSLHIESFGVERLKHSGPQQLEDPSRVSFLHLNVRGELQELLQRKDFVQFLRNRYNIVMMYWEVEVPAEHASILRRMHEVWCASPFLIRMLRWSCPHCKARLVRPSLTPPPPPAVQVDRKRLGLPLGDFIFFYNFDALSDVDRKNPLALATAFDQEFSGNEKAMCVVKLKNAVREHPQLSGLQAIANRNKMVRLISETLSKEQMGELYAAIDCYVSPHRSEGLGHTILEGMLREKPVIATGYGGVADVTCEPYAFPVEFDKVRVGDNNPNYNPSSTWADPRLPSLRRRLREVFADPQRAREVAARGAAHVRQVFSVARSAATVARALTEIQRDISVNVPRRKWVSSVTTG